MAPIAVFVDDLMLASRVTESLAASGHQPIIARSAREAEGVVLVICDLDCVDHSEMAALDIPVIGFYSHVDQETREKAEEAGVDLVIPRSRMARELPDLIARFV